MSNTKWSPYATKYDPLAIGSIDGTDKEPHDSGIVRAINSEYTYDYTLPGSSEKTIFVGRLHPLVTEEELEAFFTKFGKIKRCKVVRDIVTGNSKQYAFIEFDRRSEVHAAYRKGDNLVLRGAEIIVDYKNATMRGWKPRRLGGGFGGRKESGQLRFGCRDRPWRKPIAPYR